MKIQKKAELLTTGLITVTSLVALIFATFSWFEVSKEASSTSTAIIYQDDVQIDYTVYKCDNETHVVSTTDSNNNKLSLVDLDLNKYDAVFTEKNEWSPIIVRFELTGSTLPGDGSIGIQITRTSSIADGDGVVSSSTSKLAAVTSNVCTFGAGTNFTISDNNDDEKVYLESVNEFQTNVTLQNFVTGTTGSYTKVSTLYYDLPYTSTAFNGNTLYVYLYISYNSILAQEYVDNRDESIVDIVTDGLNVSILNDLDSISINHT